MPWRPEDDFFVDLALAKERADFGSLTAGTVAAKGSLFGRARCGQCDKRLRLEPTGRRLQSAVRMPIDESHLRAEFEVDLPEVACQSCTARPSPESKAIAKTAADIDGWLFQLIADAMPPERAVRVEPRAAQ